MAIQIDDLQPVTEGSWRHERQRLLRKRLGRRRITGSSPAQSLRELRAIPPGTPVVLHLLNSANGARPEHLRGLAGVGLLSERRTGAKKRVKISRGHVGAAATCTWRAHLASPGIAQLTRYMFVDPGDEILDQFEHEEGERVKVERFKTSLDEPAAIVSTEPGQGVRMESQPDGFGLVWSTDLDVVTALSRALAVLPEPESGDDARVVFGGDRREDIPARDLKSVLAQHAAEISLVRLDIGPASLAWTENGNGTGPKRRMSYGDDYYVREQVQALLRETEAVPDSEVLQEVLVVADETLAEHIAPA